MGGCAFAEGSFPADFRKNHLTTYRKISGQIFDGLFPSFIETFSLKKNHSDGFRFSYKNTIFKKSDTLHKLD
jgi:hypothetical protein